MSNSTKLERIPLPDDGRDVAQHVADLAKLDADPLTAGSANRPAWLVRRVLECK